ncbi:unnamed protein product [Fusarium graminearum]|nr:unnamed protein product [Fusarium graminearum]
MLASSVYISSLSPPSSPALPPAALLNQTSPQLNILTIVDHAVVIHSGGKWKVINMDPQAPGKHRLADPSQQPLACQNQLSTGQRRAS